MSWMFYAVRIGASASAKETEDDFLRGVGIHLRRILKLPKSYLDYWNYLEEVDVKTFRKDVAELLDHVENVLATPYAKRRESSF
jgi:hypothetical protein